MIPIYKPVIAKNQKKYVNEALDANELTYHGRFHRDFKLFLSFAYSTNVTLTCNGTVSLYAIIKSLKLKGEIILPSLTYIASTACVVHAGCIPVFVNSDDNFQISIEDIKKSINKNTVAVLVPSLYSDAPDLKEIRKICDDNKIYMIEDAAESFCCELENDIVGNIGHASSFSFFANKVITAGEGGCIMTKDKDLHEIFERFINHNCVGPYKHDGVGMNFRMTNLSAAIGYAQLEELNTILFIKRQIANNYTRLLDENLVESIIPKISYTSEWMPVFKIKTNMEYDEFREKMLALEVDTRPIFTPNHLTPNLGEYKNYVELDCDVIKNYRKYFSLPCYPTLTPEEAKYIIGVCHNVLRSV